MQFLFGRSSCSRPIIYIIIHNACITFKDYLNFIYIFARLPSTFSFFYHAVMLEITEIISHADYLFSLIIVKLKNILMINLLRPLFKCVTNKLESHI